MKKGWQTKSLGDVLVKTETNDPTRSPDAEFDYIDVSSISNETLTIQETQRLKGKDAPSRARRHVRTNDVLLATIRPTLRRIAIVPEELDEQICSTGYFVLRAKPEVDFRFIFYFLQTEVFMAAMEKLQKGASYPAVTDGDVRSQPIPVPPLPEQQRIVGLLDEAFEGLATAQAHAAQNLQNARDLFESHLNAIFTQRGKGWVEHRLGDVFDIGSSKRIRESEWASSGVPFYGGKEIVRLSKVGFVVSDAYISEAKYGEYALRYEMPQPGDLLITARGTIGVGYVVRYDDKFYYKDGNIISLREKTPTNPHFVLYAFRSKPVVAQFADLTGATVTHLPIERAKNLLVSMPNFPTQCTVAEHLSNIETEAQRLESVYQRKLVVLEKLKKSLLHQAFSGEL